MKRTCLRCGEYRRVAQYLRHGFECHWFTVHLELCTHCFDELKRDYGERKITAFVERIRSERKAGFDEGLEDFSKKPEKENR